ncbi:ABC transporter permease [Silvanigrella sp.]|jgi:putative ABC transport system permease protein|uniref:ABC transporter permease n=1 Tax=Silvanigrella sp. TaxID=2024976 RepID=UPI0037C87FCB
MSSSLLPVAIGILERGFIGSFVVMAIYLASRVMKFDDFSIEGTFGLGGAIVAWAILHDTNPWLALILAIISGGISGCITGLLHTKLGLNKLISGIVVTTMLFSISINIGTANVALGNAKTIFTFAQEYPFGSLIILALITFFIAYVFIWYMKTENGFILRSTGVNEQFVTSLGKSVPFYITLSLIMANSLSALAGGIFVQYSGFFSAFGNVGTLIAALAGCMIAELVAANMFLMAILGSIIYQLIIAITIELQVEPSWQKLITGLLIVVILVVKKMENIKGAKAV